MTDVIGIDLGTVNSVVAIWESGAPKVLVNSEGAYTTPSVVAYTADNQIIVGEAAKRQAITNADRTIYSAKRFIGLKKSEVSDEAKRVSYKVEASPDGSAVFKVGDKTVSPEEVGAQVIGKLKKAAEEYLGHPVKKAVITCPAAFTMAQRAATKNAAEICGLEVLRVISEPTAAAVAYGLDKTKDQLVLIQDFGGGTADLSIVEIQGGVCEVLGSSGDTHLGGDDADLRLVDYLADEFQKLNGVDLRKDKMALQRLKTEAEKAKIDLSSLMEVEVSIPFITANQNGPLHLTQKITRAKFESLIEDLIDRLFECAKKVLADTKKTVEQIDQVIFVGGSTRIPLVYERTKKMFGKEPNRSVNVDQIVALGAATQAGILSGEKTDLLLLDVCPLGMGIETLGGVFTTLVPRNTTIPTKRSEVFSTAADNQPSVSVRIAQGERPMFADNHLLGAFNLDGLPPAKRGTVQIEVAFDIDASGLLTVSAKDRGTGKSKDIIIKTGLSKDEIAKMIKDAEANEAADKRKAELAQKFNQLDGFVLSLRKTLDDNAEKLAGQKDAIEAALKDSEEVLAGRKEDKIDETMKSLEAVAHKAAEELYKQAAPQDGPVEATVVDEKEAV